MLSTLPITAKTLRGAAVVALLPTTAILYTLVTTPFWSVAFLVPAVTLVGFADSFSRSRPRTRPRDPRRSRRTPIRCRHHRVRELSSRL